MPVVGLHGAWILATNTAMSPLAHGQAQSRVPEHSSLLGRVRESCVSAVLAGPLPATRMHSAFLWSVVTR